MLVSGRESSSEIREDSACGSEVSMFMVRALGLQVLRWSCHTITSKGRSSCCAQPHVGDSTHQIMLTHSVIKYNIVALLLLNYSNLFMLKFSFRFRKKNPMKIVKTKEILNQISFKHFHLSGYLA